MLFLALLLAFFRGALGSSTRLLECLRGHALGRGWLGVVLLLECRTLPLLFLPRLHRLLRLEGALALQGLLLLRLLENCTLPLQGLRLLLRLEGTLAL